MNDACDAEWIGPRELAAMRGGSVRAATMWIARREADGAPTRRVSSRRGRPERQIARAYLFD